MEYALAYNDAQLAEPYPRLLLVDGNRMAKVYFLSRAGRIHRALGAVVPDFCNPVGEIGRSNLRNKGVPPSYNKKEQTGRMYMRFWFGIFIRTRRSNMTQRNNCCCGGPMGPMGPQGATGVAGPKGNTGAVGATGPKGDKGDKGATGAKGDPGAVGATGPKGDKGDKGATGAKRGSGSSRSNRRKGRSRSSRGYRPKKAIQEQ